jgi:hypothetical protein
VRRKRLSNGFSKPRRRQSAEGQNLHIEFTDKLRGERPAIERLKRVSG